MPHFDSKYAVEQAIAQSAVQYTIIAPAFFMDNLTSPCSRRASRTESWRWRCPERRRCTDRGGRYRRLCGAVIERRESVFGRRFDIAGDELSGDAAAEVLSEITDPGPSRMQDSLQTQCARRGEDMALMYEWFESTGYSADIDGLRREFPDVPVAPVRRVGAETGVGARARVSGRDTGRSLLLHVAHHRQCQSKLADLQT